MFFGKHFVVLGIVNLLKGFGGETVSVIFLDKSDALEFRLLIHLARNLNIHCIYKCHSMLEGILHQRKKNQVRNLRRLNLLGHIVRKLDAIGEP